MLIRGPERVSVAPQRETLPGRLARAAFGLSGFPLSA